MTLMMVYGIGKVHTQKIGAGAITTLAPGQWKASGQALTQPQAIGQTTVQAHTLLTNQAHGIPGKAAILPPGQALTQSLIMRKHTKRKSLLPRKKRRKRRRKR